MKALVCIEPNKMVVEDRDVQPVPEGWVPLDIMRVGICGTDYHIFSGNQPFFEYPRVMGHEISARVSADYAGTDFAPGELVVVNPYLSCGSCHACALGKPNCCENISVLGVHRDGAMTEKLAVPAGNLLSAGGLTPDQAAMVEFLAIGRHAVSRTHVGPGRDVLIVGGGPIGLACALFARMDGAQVTVADVSSAKLNILRDRFGFEVLPANDGAALASWEKRATHVFDATGNIHAMNDALRFVAHGGTYTLVSVVNEELRFADPEFHKRETTLIGSRNALAADFAAVVDAIQTGQIKTDLLKTHATTLDDASRDIEQWAADRDSVIKAIIAVA